MGSPTTRSTLADGRARPGTGRASASRFREIQPGGFILFGRNIKQRPQLRTDRRSARPERHRADHHHRPGGRPRLAPEADRQRAAERPATPANATISGSIATARRASPARLLRMFGFNLDLCPVLDISFDDEADNSLRGRCYGERRRRSSATRRRSTTACARTASRAAASISPATRARRWTRTMSCR